MKKKFLTLHSALKENLKIAKATDAIMRATYSIAEGILNDEEMEKLLHYSLTAFPSVEAFKGASNMDEITLNRYNDAVIYLSSAIIKITMVKDAPTYPVFYNSLFPVTHGNVGTMGSDQANLTNVLIQASLINPYMTSFDYLAGIKQSDMALIKRQIDDCGGPIAALYNPESKFKIN